MKANETKTASTASTTKKTARTARVAACGLALALALAAAAIAPATALANDGYGYQPAQAAQAAHYEGQKVTIGEDWAQPVYAEWHQGDSGQWWATFLTYNGATIYAQPAPAGCGWSFHAYDKDGNFQTVFRCEESAAHGLFGKEGVSSHWQDDNGTWY